MCGIFFLDESGFRANKKYSILLGLWEVWGVFRLGKKGHGMRSFFFPVFSYDLFFTWGVFLLYFPPLSLLRPSLGR